jgi:hypothetical protein
MQRVIALKIEALTSKTLMSFLRTHLSSRSFLLFVHILTNPFIDLFCSLPRTVKLVSRIYLDEEKYKINDYAVRKLRECGFRNVYYIGRLHAKLLITEDFVLIGSANYSERALSNHEVLLVIWKNYRSIQGLSSIIHKLMSIGVPAKVHKYVDKKTNDIGEES